MRVIGDDPRPVGLIHPDLADRDELLSLFLSGEIGTASQVKRADFDVMVTRYPVVKEVPRTGGSSMVDMSTGLRLITAATSRLPWLAMIKPDGEEVTVRLSRSGDRSRRVHISEDVPPEFIPLVDSLAARSTEAVRAGESHDVLRSGSPFTREIPTLRVWLATDDGAPIVAMWERAADGMPVLSLPSNVDLVEWTRAALTFWAKDQQLWQFDWLDTATWKERGEWRSQAQVKVDGALAGIYAERERFLADYSAQVEGLLKEAEQAKSEATLRFHPIVEAGSDELEAVVAACLEDLGFTVESMDDVFPKGQKREDLRVRDADNEDWIAIAEVRAYPGGGKEDFMRLFTKWSPLFREDEGRYPSATWWIANTFRDRDVTEREPLLAAKEELLGQYEEAGFLAIDTSHLLALWLDVDAGVISPQEARALLRENTGRFEYRRK